jgi:hypothetical protein
MSFLRGVLQNLEFVKIRALENFYSIKIFEKREQEIKELIKTVSSVAIGGLCDWFVPNAFSLILIGGFMYLDFLKIDYKTFAALISTLSVIQYGFFNLMNGLMGWIEIGVSLKRIEMFMKLEELENKKSIDNNNENTQNLD